MPQIINSSEVRGNFSDFVSQAYYSGRSFMVGKIGKPLAVIMGIDEYQNYQKLKKALFLKIDKIAEDNQRVTGEKVMADIEKEREKIFKKHDKRDR